jgi:hypothetical protein
MVVSAFCLVKTGVKHGVYCNVINIRLLAQMLGSHFSYGGCDSIQLEKQGSYCLGDDHGHISYEDIGKALRVMTLTAVLFGVVVVLPVVILRIYVFGL